MRKLVLFLIVALYSNFSSGQIIVSELCDPNTDWASNRFVEIFNPSSSAVSLTGWTLEIHTNLNAGSNYFGTVDLSTAGTIAGNSAMIIASPTASNLTSVDFPVFDQSSVLWSDVYTNWNGQERDGVVLKENGVIVDYVIADNTSGSTASFFANGTLVRNPCIKEGNPTYDAAEWTYTASSFSIGSAGPSNASPGFHYYTGFDYSVTIQDETCDGNSDGFVVAVTDPATGSYNYDWEEAGGGNAQSGTNNTYNFLPPGTYNITVSNGLGCSYGESFSISQGDKPDIDNATAFAFGTCSGVCDASYTFSVSAGTPPMTVLWTGPTPGSLSTTGGAINLTGLCPGNYSVSVTDDNGCQDTQAFQAFAGTNSTSISGVSPSNASTSSSADGTAALNVSGATVGQVYQYAYQTPPNTGPVLTSSTNPITGLVAGLYSLTATTIPGGCSDVSTFTVGFNSASVTYQVEQPIGNVIAGPTYTLCPETTAYIRVFLNGSPLNTSTWTINWNATVPGGNTPPTIGSTNPAGVFLNDYAFTTVSGTATNGSTTITLPPITINTYSNPLDPFPSIADMCAGDPSVTFSSPYNVGGINYPGVFSLFQVAGNVQVAGPSSSLAIDPSALNSGSHRLEFEFTDPTSGCSFDGETTFVINPTPDFTVTNPPTECAVGASTIDLSGYTTWVSTSLTQTQSYYSYSSTPGLLGSNFDPTVAGVGTYNVTVTYQIPGGCSDQEVINITVDTGPNLSSLFPSQPVSVCGGNTLNLPLLNPSDSWSGLGVTGSSPSFVFDASLVSNGNFQVTYNESGNPCTSTLDINVTPSVVANFQPVPNSACINDATFQLTQFSSTGGSGTGTESFTTTSWPAGGVPLTVSSTGLVDLSNAVVGPYTIQYTYTEGSCTDSETASIVIQSLPQVLYTSTSPISLCSDASVDLGPLFFPSSGGTFTVNGNTLSGSTLSGSASFLTPTGNTVVYSYTDPTTQCSNSATQTFDLLVAPLFNGAVFNESCPGENDGSIGISLTAGATINMTYDWSNGYSGTPLPNVGAGTYTVTVSNNGGCSTVSSFVVTAPSAINNTPTISHVTSNGGSDGSINLTVSGGTAPYSYNWSAGLPPIEDQVNLTAGTYSVTITDANGCSDVLSSLVVAQPGPLVAQGNQSDVLCFGDLIGSIDVTASGGFIPPDIPSYQYVWSTGSTSEDLLNVGAGIYQVTVTAIPTSTDQEVLSFTITQPSSLSVVGSVTDIICFANSSGAISTTVSGGVAPYTYDWSNGFAIPNIAGLLAGTYSLTVTDNNGCSSAQSWTINQPIGPFDYGFTANNVACFGDSTGSIQLNMFPGATPPFSFLWSNGSTTQDLTGVPSGLYSVVITDANGCSTVAGAPPVAQPSGPVGSTGNVSDVSSFGAGDGAIVLSTTGGSPGYNYSWIGPNGSFPGGAVISGLDGGTYSVTTTDANGCSSISTFTVNEPGQLIVSGIANDETCHGTADGSIDLSISSNGIPSIIWSNGSTIEDLFGLAVGTYSVTVTDGPQIASLSFTIGTATILNFSLALPTDSFCLADALPLTGTTSNVGATESYKIDGTLVLGTSVPLSTYTVGTHELRYIVSLAGCTDSVSVLFELLEPYPTVPQSSAIVCPTGVNVNLTSLLNGAAMLALPDTGRWFDPSGLSVTSTFDPSAGPYGVYQYQISNFCGTTIYTMDVGAVQNTIAFSTPDSLCQNESFIDLNNFVLPAGGTWSGGTTTGLFDPGLASPGAFWFYYSVTSAGCTFTDSIQIQVVASPLVAIDTSLVPVLCTANNSDTLSFGSPPGGVYSSTTASIGQSGLAFILDPQASGAGTHDIQYYFTDALSGCSDSAQISISISATINTAIGPFSDTLCVGDLPIPLPVGLPTGGSFSGPGVVGNNFSPAAAGVGSHYLQYSFAGDPCYISDSISIVVTDVPSINLPTVPDLCSSDPAFSLTGASPVGGTWIGNNVVNGQFLPALAGPGTHEIVYYYNSGGNCGNYDTTFVTVLSGTSLTLSPLGPFCEGDANLSLSNVSPSGGTYSGPGVVNGVFSPQNAGVGSHSISYTYTNAQGCLTDTIFNILVQPLPMDTLSGQPDFCEGDPPSLLSGGSPAGGIYTGSGVINDTLFDPFVAGQGSHLLTYTYTDSSGCSASISTQIQVYPTPPEPSINKTINFLVCDWGFYDYQWFFDGDSIPNSNNIKWTAADTGYYQVMLINEWGCTNISDSLFVDIIYPTNLSELEWPELQIYPNPTRGTVSLNLPLRAREIQYKWVNPMGQSLDEGYIPSGDPIQWQYNLSRFASGTYVLVLKSENQILHLRVVLEH